MRERALRVGARAGAALALGGLLGALLSDGPYLSSGSLSPWVVIWAIGLFGLLLFAPFALHRRLSEHGDDRDRRWELAIVAWGGVALALGLLFAVVAAVEGFGTGTGLGALAIVGLAECALVAGSVLLLMLTTG